MSSINFFTEDIQYKLANKALIRSWITKIIKEESYSIDNINYIICSDNYLLEINRNYLSHDYLTDIITFDNSEKDKHINADIFISIERVNDNANLLNTNPQTELHRVLIHGILHLLGWRDKSDDEQKVMREKEEACLSLLELK